MFSPALNPQGYLPDGYFPPPGFFSSGYPSARRGGLPGEGIIDRRIEPRRKTIDEQIRIDDERDVIAYIDHFMRTLAE